MERTPGGRRGGVGEEEGWVGEGGEREEERDGGRRNGVSVQ